MTPIEGPSDQYLLSGKNSGQGQAREASTRHSMTGHSHDRHRPCHDRHRPCHDRTQAMTGHRPCHDRTQAMTEQGRAGPGPVQGRQDQDQYKAGRTRTRNSTRHSTRHSTRPSTRPSTTPSTRYPTAQVPGTQCHHCPGTTTRYPAPVPVPAHRTP